MTGFEINGLAFGLVAVVLLLFGLTVNALVHWLGRWGALEGRRALLVVVGVFGTLIGSVFVIGLIPALLVGFLFVASGTPMIVGEWLRDAQDKRQALAALAEGLDHAES